MAAITLVYMTALTIFFLIFAAAEYAWMSGVERISGCCEVMLGRIAAPDADQKTVLAFNKTNRNVWNCYIALLGVVILTVAFDAMLIPINH